MDFSILDKSSGVTPILVRLYDSHKLHGLAKDKKPLARAELTSAISDLLQMDLTPRENELVADVLIALMRQAEKDLRIALAERLSVSDKAPLRLVLQIANDEIEIAAPVLRNSAVLGDVDLIYIIKSKGADYWREIASRKTISDHVQGVLIDTRDMQTAITLAENNNVKLSEHVLSILSELAQKSEDVATPLLRRDDITPDIVEKLYQFVGQELKKYIVDNYDISASLLSDAIDDIVFEISDVSSGNSDFMPNQAAIKSAERFQEKGLLTVKTMLATLKRGQVPSFIAMFSKFTGMQHDTILSILKQPSGQGMAVVCRAFEIVKPDFISLYLLSNIVRNKAKMVDVKDISRAISYYERIQPEIARGIMKNSISKTLKD